MAIADPTKLGVGNRRFTGALTTWVAGNDIYDFHDAFTPNSLIFRFRTYAYSYRPNT